MSLSSSFFAFKTTFKSTLSRTSAVPLFAWLRLLLALTTHPAKPSSSRAIDYDAPRCCPCSPALPAHPRRSTRCQACSHKVISQAVGLSHPEHYRACESSGLEFRLSDQTLPCFAIVPACHATVPLTCMRLVGVQGRERASAESRCGTDAVYIPRSVVRCVTPEWAAVVLCGREGRQGDDPDILAESLCLRLCYVVLWRGGRDTHVVVRVSRTKLTCLLARLPRWKMPRWKMPRWKMPRWKMPRSNPCGHR